MKHRGVNKQKKNIQIMDNNMVLDNNITDLGYLIFSGLLLSFALYYWIRSNDNVIYYQITEVLRNEDGENAIIDSDSDTDTDTDTDTEVESDIESTSDNESILDVDIIDLDLFFMPNVDFDVCSIYELKFFEISSIFYREIAEKFITDEELIELISLFTKAELATNWINDYLHHIISLF